MTFFNPNTERLSTPPLQNSAPGPREPKGTAFKMAVTIGLTALVAGVGGAAVGAATAETSGSAPAPAATPEPEVVTETIEVVDETCREVAIELKGILDVGISDVMLPYSEVTQTLIDQMLLGADVATIDGATAKVEGAGSAAGEMNDRIVALTEDYQECTG